MDSLNHLLILIFVCFQLWNGLASFSAHHECQLEYRVEYGNGQIVINPQWKTESCREEEGFVIPDLWMVGIQPLVRLSMCNRKVVSGGSTSLSIGHTLLTLARENHSSCTNTTTGCPLFWTVGIPSSFSNIQCMEVLVQSSDLGMGAQIENTRIQIWTTEIEEATDVEQAIFTENGVEIVDAENHDGTSAVLVRNPVNESFQLHHSLSSDGPHDEDQQEWMINSLPGCVDYHGGQELLLALWKTVDGNGTDESCNGENSYQFIPTRVAAVSRTEIYIIGNGLLFSPNRGISLYSLQAPGMVQETRSFAASSNSDVYALLWNRANQTNLTANEVWLGFIGKTDLFLLYPSTICDVYWQSLGLELEDPTLQNTTLEFDNSNNLYLVTGSSSLKLPLSLLILTQEHNTQLGQHSVNCITPQSPSTTSQYHPLYQIGLQYHPLAICATASCPFIDRVVQVQRCGKITRTKFHTTEEGILGRLNKTAMAELNCSISGTSLPGDIFLDKSEQYNFTMEFFLGTESPDLDAFSLAVKLSTPDALSIQVRRFYQSITNSLIFEVFLKELQRHNRQFESGFISTSVDISLFVMEATIQCLDPSSTSVELPGHVHTRVHIGCPPGLSIVFDAATTSSHHNQYCTPTSNISCFYFGNSFHPTFLFVDSVTEERSIFMGQYTLRAIAGGSSDNNMRPFSPMDIVEAGIWTPVNESKDDPVPAYNYTDNGLTWVCSTTAPCGEKIPGSGRSPEYYLLLEASNMMVGNDTYCALSVQFTIKLHGLSMGGITTVVSLITFLILCSLGVLLMFVAFHYRLKFLYCKDTIVDKWNNCWPDNRERLIALIRKHRGKVNPTLQ